MNQYIETSLTYLAGDDSVYGQLLDYSQDLKNSLSSWEWQVAGDHDKALALADNLMALILLEVTTGDEALRRLKITALGQFSQLSLTVELQQECEKRFASYAPYACELWDCFECNDLDDLIPLTSAPNVLHFKRAPKTFIDSYYSMAAHSGLNDDQSPIPPLEIGGGYQLTCAFPEPKNYCRVWLELRKDDQIAAGVVHEIRLGGQVLSLSAGECEAQITENELASLLVGELPMQLEMTLS